MKTTLSVLSYNIHKGYRLGNQTFVLKAIKQAIRSVQADLVFLQEVVGGHQKTEIHDWPTNNQFEFLADELWPHYAYGQNAVYTEGHHGNAILSKFPIKKWDNIDVSQNAMASRGILHAELNVAGTPLHALCLHFDLLKSDRQKQVQILAQRIEEHIPHSEPLIIGGDFNDWTVAASHHLRHTLEIQEAFQVITGRHARTFPSRMPALMLDRIYFRGLAVHQVRRMTGTPWNALSDHLAIGADFELTLHVGSRISSK